MNSFLIIQCINLISINEWLHGFSIKSRLLYAIQSVNVIIVLIIIAWVCCYSTTSDSEKLKFKKQNKKNPISKQWKKKKQCIIFKSK